MSTSIAFSTALQNIRVCLTDTECGEKSIAQKFYNGLLALLKQYMALYDSKHEYIPDIRNDYYALQKEVRNVKHWRPFTDALAQLSKAKAFKSCQPLRPRGIFPTPPRTQSGDLRSINLYLQQVTPSNLLPVAKIRKQKHGFRVLLLNLMLHMEKCVMAHSDVYYWGQT